MGAPIEVTVRVAVVVVVGEGLGVVGEEVLGLGGELGVGPVGGLQANLGEDEVRDREDEVQKAVKKYEKEVETIISAKEKEITTV